METLLPLALFAFVSSITPGPNNIMLTSSGILFGFVRSIPHMLGITVGFGVMLALCATGIGGLILAVPAIQVILKVLGSGYLLYLAWQLRRMAFRQDDSGRAKPMSFLGAAAFQFANPKAWVMAVTGVSAFLPAMQPVWFAITMFCLVFCAINLPCVGVWAGTGAALRRHLAQPKWQQVFCIVMVSLTVYSAVAIWM
ncbi:LysE family translocator [Noviherbaspirillum cavernae]|uniref:LysE family translocator n=1 Tax=Noviherbaspirillum cavernae TaxID=2320862 RepID=A0A418WZA9_9BURK|nr:LysE family translocator [Noviherbaspirillum cavernae]RJG05415.1 LysE family translocator [Noviherbaspirillum cavernae]